MAAFPEAFLNRGDPPTSPCTVHVTGSYRMYAGYPSGSNISDEYPPGSRRVRAHSVDEIDRVRNWVERFGVEHVSNLDVLFELEKLNRKALKVFTASRRDGYGEVESLVKAVWSMK